MARLETLPTHLRPGGGIRGQEVVRRLRMSERGRAIGLVISRTEGLVDLRMGCIGLALVEWDLRDILTEEYLLAEVLKQRYV